MPIIRWRPFSELEHLFDNNSSDLAADVYEKDDMIYVEMHIPGLKPDEIDISVEDNHLRVSGSRKEKEEVSDRGYYYKEIRRGNFERVLTLPTAVDSTKASAEFSHGVLKIDLPKKIIGEPKKIKVNKK